MSAQSTKTPAAGETDGENPSAAGDETGGGIFPAAETSPAGDHPHAAPAMAGRRFSGSFGRFGGSHVPPKLAATLATIAAAYEHYRDNAAFQAELDYYLTHWVGRETPLFYAANLSRQLGGAGIYLKREDLNHLGAHKVNNALGQALLAKRLGKTRLIAETGAGQHGVATSAAAALLGLECTVYMGALDAARQRLNVERMRLLGSEVASVSRGGAGLKEAVDEAMQAWQSAPDLFYVIGSAVGPHPYPLMARDFQSVIGRETRRQIREAAGRLPDYCLACVGGGSNAIGLFHPFLEDRAVKLVGVEPGGRGSGLGQHAAALCHGAPGVLHGSFSYLLQDEAGRVAPAHSISAGLGYPGVGPEHSFLKESGRAEYVTVSDAAALAAFRLLCRAEGIIPALESAHALAQAVELAPKLTSDQIIIVALSGRGDKDMDQVAEMLP